MTDKTFNVLFLCTGNSARSVMSEALVTILGRGRFKGYSAGSKPSGRVNAYAVEQILTLAPAYPVEEFRSKSWDEFAAQDAPHMDFIVTVCDNAAGETCPYWPGRPANAHWGYEDPHGESEEAARASFHKIFNQIKRRIEAFVALPVESMDANAVREAIKAIGEIPV